MKFKKILLKDISLKGKGEYGIGASAVPYSVKLPKYLRITDINLDGTLKYEDMKSVNDINSKKYILSENDIVFARTGNSTGKNYFYDISDGELVYAGFLIKFSLDPNKVVPKFIKYYCMSSYYWGWINGVSTGSTRANINAKTYGELPLILPNLSYQQKSVRILEILDKKIKLNNQMIDTLEEMASTLFKRWFVDFEFPDENGNPYKSSGGKMIDSELGEIPEGWRVCCISEIIEKSTNKVEIDQLSLKNYVSTENLLPSKKGLINAAKLPNQIKVNKFEENDILISNIRPYFKKIWYSDRIGGYSNDVLNFKSNKTVSSEFLYLYLKDDSFFNFMVATSKGTKMPRGDKTAIQNKELVIPCKSIDELFKAKIIYWLRKIKTLNSQNTELGMLRDTLLPKFLTGEIEV